MGIHDRDVSLHLLDFDEPIQTSLEEDLMDARHTICLREEEGEWRLEICRESRIDVCLEIGTLEARTRIVDRDTISISIE